MPKTTPDSMPSFPKWLSKQPDDFLIRLLHNRLQVATPQPADFDTLAARLQLRSDMWPILLQLSALELAVAEAAIYLLDDEEEAATSITELSDTVQEFLTEAEYDSADPQLKLPELSDVVSALTRLQEFGVVYGLDTALDPADATVTFSLEFLDSYPTWWSVFPSPGAPSLQKVRAMLADLDEAQLSIVQKLAEHRGMGASKDAAEDADPETPVARLLAAGIIERVEGNLVRLLPEVLRVVSEEQLSVGQLSFMESVAVSPRPSQLPPLPLEHLRSVDHACLAAAYHTASQLMDFLQALGRTPLPELKSGGTGARSQQRLAETMGITELELARVADYAWRAGLVSVGVPRPLPPADNGGTYFASTELADEFLAQPISTRLAWLAAWAITAKSRPWLIGTKDNQGKRIALFGSNTRPRFTDGDNAADDALAPDFQLLRVLAGRAVATQEPQLSTDDAKQLFASARPFAALNFSDADFDHTLQQWAGSGLVLLTRRAGIDYIAVSSLGIAVATAPHASNPDSRLVETVAALLPPATDQFLVQADHTIMVPAPATATVEQMLRLCAAVESPGLASMYRLTEKTLQHALTSGVSETELLKFFQHHTIGAVPQSVEYLIKDAARLLQQETPTGAPGRASSSARRPSRILEPLLIFSTSSGSGSSSSPGRTAPEDNFLDYFRQLLADTCLNNALLPQEDNRLQRLGNVVKHLKSTQLPGRKNPDHRNPRPQNYPSYTAMLQAAVHSGTAVEIQFAGNSGEIKSQVMQPLSLAEGNVIGRNSVTHTITRIAMSRIVSVQRSE